MPYELRRDDIFGFAQKIGAQVREKGDELFFKHCPYCNGSGKDTETFSINLDTGMYKCFRATCGRQGHFVQLARDFGYPLDFGNPIKPIKKRFRKLPQQMITTRDKAIEYLQSRGIGGEITERYSITTRKDNDNILVFPFYDENHQLQFIKYRKINFDKARDKNKEWCEAGTKPILFGMDQCVDREYLVITEGQIDSLTLAQCGVKNAVSVPTGAMGFTWLEWCWDWVNSFGYVCVFGDYEYGEITLSETLTKRLMVPVRVVQPEMYYGEKDANAIFCKYGKQAILDAVSGAKELPVNRVKPLADVQAVDIYKLDKIKTNINEIDRLIGGFFFGQVVLLTGKRGEGKSTFMSQLMAEALDQGYKTLAYSGELPDYHFKAWLDMQLAGPKNVQSYKNEFGDDVYYITNETSKRIADWYRSNAYIYDNNAVGDEDEYDGLLTTVEQAVRRYGIKLVCIDNLMTALEVELKDDLYRAQSKFVKRLKEIAVKYDIVVLLVAHPKKTQNRIENDDVLGSSDITNRVDVVLSYSRDTGEMCDGRLAILKNRLTGKITRKDAEIQLFYSNSTKRITSVSSGGKVYGWATSWVDEIDPDDMEEISFF